MTWIVGLILGLLLVASMGTAAQQPSVPSVPTVNNRYQNWCEPLLPDDGGGHGRIVAVPVTTPDADC